MTIRVLHCIPGMGGGGAERQLAYLAGELTRHDCDVHVALVSEGPNYERLRSSGAAVHRVTAHGNHDPLILQKLVRTIRAVRPHVVQVWLLQMQVLGGLAATVTGTPWIFTERSSETAYPRSLKNWLRVTMASRATAVVSNSNGGDDYWRRRLSSATPRYVVRNAVPLQETACAPLPDRRQLEVPADDRVILFAGRFSAEKDIELLVEALAPIVRRDHVRAVLAGDGPLRAGVERRLVTLGLSDRIIISDYLPNIWSWMKRASLFVAPSIFEGHPNAVLEAMACECPVVVSDIPAHREFLTDEMALFVPPRDAPALTAAMSIALADQEASSRRALSAKRKVKEWSVESIAGSYRRIYEDLLGTRAAAGREQA